MLLRLLVQSLPSLWFVADGDYVALLSSFVTTAFPCQSLKPLPATSVLERAKGGVWWLQRDLCSGARWECRASFFLLVSGCGQTPGLVPQVHTSAMGSSFNSLQLLGCWRHLQPGTSYWHQGFKYLIKSGWSLKLDKEIDFGESSQSGGQEGITRLTQRKNKQRKRTWVSIKWWSLK